MVTQMDKANSESIGTSGSSDDDDGSLLDGSEQGTKDADFSTDKVMARLAASGPVGLAAAAAIVSSKKRRKLYSFETNPTIRRRQQTRLLRKLKQTVDEFSTRIGQQAVVLIATPGKPGSNFRCFGAQPLEDVVKNLRLVIMGELEAALAQHVYTPAPDNPSLYDLPPLTIDGIPTPVEKMTQAQLRAFIPLMLKFSTGRGKPGWGRENMKPPWWPKGMPWANLRIDVRSDEEKQKISWTHALRQVVVSCYEYHGREDLLHEFSHEEEAKDEAKSPKETPKADNAELEQPAFSWPFLQTFRNPDGTVSLIQVDPNNPVITLPDGTTALVEGLATLTDENGASVCASVSEVNDQLDSGSVELTSITGATLNQHGQLVLTGEDNRGFPISVSGTITLPVSGSVYQPVLSGMQQIQGSQLGDAIQVVDLNDVQKGQAGIENAEEVDPNAVPSHQIIAVPANGLSPQILQVANSFSGNTIHISEIKTEEISRESE